MLILLVKNDISKNDGIGNPKGPFLHKKKKKTANKLLKKKLS